MTRLSEERGTTLVELVVAIGLLLIVMGPMLSAYMVGVKTEKASEVRDVALEDLRISMARMAKDVRQSIEIEATSTPSRLAMQTLIDGSQHRVVFDVVDGELRRTVGTGAPATIAHRVVNTDLFCYDAPTCAAPSPSDGIELVRIGLELKPSQATAPPIVMATTIQLRNLPAVI